MAMAARRRPPVRADSKTKSCRYLACCSNTSCSSNATWFAEDKLELSVMPQRLDVIWQALVSPECGQALPHYLDTESLVRLVHHYLSLPASPRSHPVPQLQQYSLSAEPDWYDRTLRRLDMVSMHSSPVRLRAPKPLVSPPHWRRHRYRLWHRCRCLVRLFQQGRAYAQLTSQH